MINKRIIAAIMAALIVFGTIFGFLTMIASAAILDPTITGINKNGYDRIKSGAKISFTFEYTDDSAGAIKLAVNDKFKNAKKMAITHWNATDASLSLKVIKHDGNLVTFEGTLENLIYTSSATHTDLVLENIDLSTSDYSFNKITLDIPATDFDKNSGSSTSDNDSYTSQIIVENVIITDSTGERLDKITKDSPPFNIGVIFVDYGLQEIDSDDLKNEVDFEAFMSSYGGFTPPASGFKGTMRKVASSSNDAPRFRVDFKNFKYTGSGSSIEAKVRYDILGIITEGSFSATIHQAKSDSENDDKEKAPPTPYIIVNKFSYGEDAIEAGSKFTLSLTFENTSSEISLENIIMTVTTPESMQISSGSNTYYIRDLKAGGIMPYSLELETMPSAKVGSSAVQIDFSYQYLVKSERKEFKTSENIAIPITQLDRFEVDPIADAPGGTIGNEIYIPISFINRGMSTARNISAKAESDQDISAPTEHFGNLDAGKSDTMEIRIVPNVSGEIFGNIIVQYEDENNNQKEIKIPFSVFSEELYMPPPTDNPGFDPDIIVPPPTNTKAQIILNIVGALLIAAPLALYFMKKVKQKGSDDFNEDF